MSQEKLDHLCLQAASEAFATERLPDYYKWSEMTEEEQNEWLDDHRYAPFANDQTDEFFGLIEDHSDVIKTLILDVLDFAEIGTCRSMIDGTMPEEATDLDLQRLALATLDSGVDSLSNRNISALKHMNKVLSQQS